MLTTTITTADRNAAEQIRSAAEQRYASVRSRGELTVPAIRKAIAVIYLDARARMSTYEATATDDHTRQEQRLTAAVWGIGDIGSTGLDRATASVSYRDAQDRAAGLDDDGDAARLLTRAEASGDELLARAVAQVAWTNGWGDILDAYLATRPQAGTALADLDNMRGNLGAADLFTYMVPTPHELAGLDDWRVAALAADTSIPSI